MFSKKLISATGFVLVLTASACTSTARDERARFAAISQPELELIKEALEPGRTRPESARPRGETSLPELLKLSSVRSPLLGAAYYRWRGAVKNIGTAVAMPDAMLEYEQFLSAEPANIMRMEERRRVMLTQEIPNPGLLVARQQMLAAEASSMAEEFDAVKRELFRRVAVSFYDVQALDARVTLTRQLVEIARAIEAGMEPMLVSGGASQSELLRMQVEREELEGMLLSQSLRRRALVSALSAASGVELAPDVRLPGLQDPALPSQPHSRALLVVKLDEHPMLQMEHAKAAVAHGRVVEAKWMWVPDFFVGGEWMEVDAPMGMKGTRNVVGVRAGISIPWKFHVNAARSDAARANELAARFVIEQKRLDLKAELDSMLFELADAERMLMLLNQSTLPKARQALELARGDFSTGKASLTDVLSTQNTWLAGELSLINARVDLLKTRAGLESLTGLSFSGE